MTPADLRARRQALHLSQEALARLLGVSTNSVVRWESGSRKPPKLLERALAHLETERTAATGDTARTGE